MAGHRGGRAGRVAGWRARYWDRIEAADGPTKVRVAADLFCLVIDKCASPEQQNHLVATAVANLAGPAEQVLNRYETRGRG
jgi:hypothetical protein